MKSHILQKSRKRRSSESKVLKAILFSTLVSGMNSGLCLLKEDENDTGRTQECNNGSDDNGHNESSD